MVAAILAELGYSVTVIDPYDGSGGGPTQFEDFVRLYPKVRIVRAEFQPDLPQLKNQYSMRSTRLASLNMFPNQHCKHYSKVSPGIWNLAGNRFTPSIA